MANVWHLCSSNSFISRVVTLGEYPPPPYFAGYHEREIGQHESGVQNHKRWRHAALIPWVPLNRGDILYTRRCHITITISTQPGVSSRSGADYLGDRLYRSGLSVSKKTVEEPRGPPGHASPPAQQLFVLNGINTQ